MNHFSLALDAAMLIPITVNLLSQILKIRPRTALASGALAVSLVWALAALRKHWNFGTHAYDLGIFGNALWNLVHGNGYVSSIKNGMNLFGDHQSPILWLFAPFYALLPYPETLLFLQSVALALGGIAAYLIARDYTSPSWKKWLPAVPILYWIYAPVRAANLFEFHPEVLGAPLFMFGIAAAHRKNIYCLIPLLLALGAKESAPILGVGIGIAWLLGAAPAPARAWTRRFAPPWIIGCIAVWSFDILVVPKLLGTPYAYSGLLGHLGSSPFEVLLSPFTRPEAFWGTLLSPTRFRFVLWLVGPTAFVAVLGWRALIACAPLLILFLVQGDDHRISKSYHYGVEFVPAVFWAFALGMSRIKHPLLKKHWPWLLPLFALTFYGRSELYVIFEQSPTPHKLWLKEEVLPRIHPNLNISASGSLVPHLMNRPWIDYLPRIPEHIDCIIYDASLNNWPMIGGEWEKLRNTFQTRNFRKVSTDNGVEIYESTKATSGCLASQ